MHEHKMLTGAPQVSPGLGLMSDYLFLRNLKSRKETQNFGCEQCYKAFKRVQVFGTHIRTCGEKVQCDFCEKAPEQEESL